VVPRLGRDVPEAALRPLLPERGRMARFRYAAALPVAPSGKVDRAELRTAALLEAGATAGPAAAQQAQTDTGAAADAGPGPAGAGAAVGPAAPTKPAGAGAAARRPGRSGGGTGAGTAEVVR
jgi:hypothetical protein